MNASRCAPLLLLVLFVSGCGSDDSPSSDTGGSSGAGGAGGAGGSSGTGGSSDHHPLVLFTHSQELDAYDIVSGEKQSIISGNPTGALPDIPAINGQVCMVPDGSGRVVTGEDAAQPNPPAHWSIFQLTGKDVGAITAEKLIDLTPTYQASSDTPDNHGCGFLADGRLLLADIGNAASGTGGGQLTIWFPPFEGSVKFCKLDTTLATPGGIYVDDQDRIYITSARPLSGGVFRYTGPYPTGDDATHGCGKVDAVGSPLADDVKREVFIAQDTHAATPYGVTASGSGTFYVASVFNGNISEYDDAGAYVRTILEPPAGETVGATPLSTGNPSDLIIAPDGALYYADLGLVVSSGGVDSGDHTSTFRRIALDGATPGAPETLASGLNYADGVGLYLP